MNKLLFDTNYLVRLIVADNVKQIDEMKLVLVQAIKGELVIYIDSSTIFELQYVLTGEFYNLSKVDFVDKVNQLLDLNCLLFLEREIIIRTLELFGDNNLDINDCYLIAKSLYSGLIFTTFDKKAKKLFESIV